MCLLCDMRSGNAGSAPALTASHRWSSRRGFLLAAVAATTGAATAPALGQVSVGPPSRMRQLVPAEVLENAAAQQFVQMMQQAHSQGALLPESHPQVQRLHGIARRLIPHAAPWNPRSRDGKWQVQLIRSDQINAFCMPGGKIGFFTGILDQLKLDDDETAMIMGHEMAHALREHARARLAKSQATSIGLSIGAQLLGLGDLGNIAANLGTELLTLQFSRSDETEADLVGLELAARGAYQPQASVTLWEKMTAQTGSGGPAFLSTHPSGPNRIRELQANVPKVAALYQAALERKQR
jgi:Zn-dependent protease with chaperone function